MIFAHKFRLPYLDSHIIISEFARRAGVACAVEMLAMVVGLTGCESAHVGMGIPVPGPVKPSVGVTVNKSGVKGHGGVSAKAGPVPISVGGTTKPVKMTENSEPTKGKKTSESAKATKKSK